MDGLCGGVCVCWVWCRVRGARVARGARGAPADVGKVGGGGEGASLPRTSHRQSSCQLRSSLVTVSLMSAISGGHGASCTILPIFLMSCACAMGVLEVSVRSACGVSARVALEYVRMWISVRGRGARCERARGASVCACPGGDAPVVCAQLYWYTCRCVGVGAACLERTSRSIFLSMPLGSETGRHSPIDLATADGALVRRRERRPFGVRTKWSSCACGVVHLWQTAEPLSSIDAPSCGVVVFGVRGWRGMCGG